MKKSFSKISALILASFLMVGPSLMASESSEASQASESQEVQESQGTQESQTTTSSNLEEIAKTFDLRTYAQYDKVMGQDEKNILEFLLQLPTKNLTADLNLTVDAKADAHTTYVVTYAGKMQKNSDNELSLLGKANINISDAFKIEQEPEVTITLDPSSTDSEKKYIVTTKTNFPGEGPQIDTQELKVDENTNKVLDVVSKLKYDLRQVEEKDGSLKILALIPIEENIDELVPYAAEKGYLDQNGEKLSEEKQKEGIEKMHEGIDKVKKATNIETLVLPINLTYSTDSKAITAISLDLASYIEMYMKIMATTGENINTPNAMNVIDNMTINKMEFALENIVPQEDKITIEVAK